MCEHGVSLFVHDPQKAEKEIPTLIQDPLVLDYFWLKLTREYNSASNRYCMKINDRILQDRCVTLVRRPHLYRE